MKPIIGIIGRPHKTNTDCNVIVCFEEYRKAVIKCGGIPITILPTQDLEYTDIRPSEMPKMTEEEKDDIKRQIDLCDGVIFAGGQRIYEYAYEAFDYIVEKDIPCLGTCLGMQTMACARGDRKSWEILTKIESNIEHRVIKPEFVHYVDICENTKLREIIGKDRIRVNSKHGYCISSCGDMKISAYSEDGIIEGIELPDKKFIIGVQWHPEDLLDEDMEKIMKEFIKRLIDVESVENV